MKIAYEKHPVSAERKAELKQKGFKILDARFEPKADKKDEVKETKAAPKPADKKADKKDDK